MADVSIKGVDKVKLMKLTRATIPMCPECGADGDCDFHVGPTPPPPTDGGEG